MQNLKAALWTVSLRQSRIGALTIEHISGANPLPFPSTWGGGFNGNAQVSPSYLVVYSPKDILTECNTQCRVTIVHIMVSFWTSTLCSARKAKLWMTRSYLDTRSENLLVSGTS